MTKQIAWIAVSLAVAFLYLLLLPSAWAGTIVTATCQLGQTYTNSDPTATSCSASDTGGNTAVASGTVGSGDMYGSVYTEGVAGGGFASLSAQFTLDLAATTDFVWTVAVETDGPYAWVTLDLAGLMEDYENVQFGPATIAETLGPGSYIVSAYAQVWGEGGAIFYVDPSESAETPEPGTILLVGVMLSGMWLKGRA